MNVSDSPRSTVPGTVKLTPTEAEALDDDSRIAPAARNAVLSVSFNRTLLVSSTRNSFVRPRQDYAAIRWLTFILYRKD